MSREITAKENYITGRVFTEMPFKSPLRHRQAIGNTLEPLRWQSYRKRPRHPLKPQDAPFAFLSEMKAKICGERVNKGMRDFWEWLLTEGQNEVQALKILNGDQKVLTKLVAVDPTPQKKYLPAIAWFFTHDKAHDLKAYFEKFKQLEDRKKVKPIQVRNTGVFYDNQPVSFLKFTEIIDGAVNLMKPAVAPVQNNAMPEDAKPLFSKNKIEVYESNSAKACIKHGRGYRFCISQPGNTMWQSYRDSQTSTFYFVFDRNRDTSDPLHVVVVDMTKDGPQLTDASNNTGYISEFGGDAKAYFKDLAKKGIPTSLFKNVPKSPQEEKEQKLLGKKNKDLTWFGKLSHEDKSKYIGRGHPLTDEQFDLLWDGKAMDLLSQYVNIGRRLPDGQMDKVLTVNQLKNSYLRARAISGIPYNYKEYKSLSPEQQDGVKKVSRVFVEAYRKNDNELVDKLLPLLPKVSILRVLHRVVKDDRIDIVKKLLDDIEPSKKLDNGMYYAISFASLPIAKLLLTKASPQFKVTEAIDTTMSMKENIPVLKLLLSKLKGGEDLREALQSGVQSSNLRAVKTLLPHVTGNIDIILDNALGDTMNNKDNEIIILLLPRAKGIGTALAVNLHVGDEKTTKLLLRKATLEDLDHAIRIFNFNDELSPTAKRTLIRRRAALKKQGTKA